MVALQAVPNIEVVFSREQLRHIVQTAANIPPDEVIKKAAIIITERRNYDSHAAGEYLTNSLPSGRVAVVNTATQSPDAVTASIKDWLETG